MSPGKWGEPDGAFVTCSGNLLEYPGDKWAIGYSGNPIPHKYPGRDLAQRQGLFPGVPGVSGLATWPKGQLVALQANGEGEFATEYVGAAGRAAARERGRRAQRLFQGRRADLGQPRRLARAHVCR